MGRLRYIGLVLYDVDRVLAAASTTDDTDLYRAQREVFLDPHDPEVIRAAEQAGIPRDWIDAAQRSPVWALNAVLRRLAAMRSYMRDINLGREPDDTIPASVGMDGEAVYDMYRLLAIAKYDERYGIPTAHAEQAHALEELATECSLDYEGGPGMGGWGPFGESSGGVTPIAVENFHMLQQRQTADEVTPMSGRVNLLNWDAKGGTQGLFAPKGAEPHDDPAAETVPRPQGPTDAAGPTGSGRRS